MSQGGSFLDGFEDGAFSGAVGGAIGGAAFSGLGVAGSTLGKGISCASKLGKAIKGRRVITRHALQNSMLPTVTVIGLQIGGLLGGSVVTETVFAWPGVGQLLIQSINARDFPMIQACIILLSAVFVLVNLVVDILYMFIDPRISYK